MRVVLPKAYLGDEIIHWLNHAIEMQTSDHVWWNAATFPTGTLAFSSYPSGAVRPSMLHTVIGRAHRHNRPPRRWWQRPTYAELEDVTIRLTPIVLDEPYTEIELLYDHVPERREHEAIAKNRLGEFTHLLLADFYKIIREPNAVAA
jgi:hypothetical protein